MCCKFFIFILSIHLLNKSLLNAAQFYNDEFPSLDDDDETNQLLNTEFHGNLDSGNSENLKKNYKKNNDIFRTVNSKNSNDAAADDDENHAPADIFYLDDNDSNLMQNPFKIDQTNNDQPYLNGKRKSFVRNTIMYTDEISLKQGKIKGLVRNLNRLSELNDVNQFLGIPYAEAPIGSMRFMPPGAPLPWNAVKMAVHYPPVCPQNIPDFNSSNIKISKGRYEQLVRLMPYLKNENEDCLYLNIYAPKKDELDKDSNKYPVIVFIHGESYEWNSGNPYDGSVLASYGQVIVVTVNYRLGILGFLKPGINEHTISNFGLLDQIAALQWIKENIESFNGDPNRVTLMGHSTGASFVNFLMVSPVAVGLFHRAILMSGTAMSDWATTNHSLALTMQIAHGMNCPLNDDNILLNCLRKKRYQDFLKIPISLPLFSTALGPIVDGHVIPNQPYKVMSQYTDLFSRYDLLFGVTEMESYHILDAIGLKDGLREGERDRLLKLYLNNRYEIRPDLAFAATIKKYTDVYNNPVKATSHEHRDVVLDILSDARIVGPLIQTGVFHAEVNARNYMYVFGHNSGSGPYGNLQHSIVGEELPFVLGVPLAPSGPFHQKYSIQEKLLSEAVMLYWSNFAKTGNPKAPWKENFINLHPMEWDRYDIDWPQFNKRNQCYVNIGIPPSVGYRYRQVYMNFWNKELPDELNHIDALNAKQPFIQYNAPKQTQRISISSSSSSANNPNEILTGSIKRYSDLNGYYSTENSIDELKKLLREPFSKELASSIDSYNRHSADNILNTQPTFGSIRTSLMKKGDDEKLDLIEISSNQNPEDSNEILKSESTLYILIGLIVVFLILNIIVYSTFLFKRKQKVNNSLTRKLGFLSYDGTTDDDLKRSRNNDGDESCIYDLMRRQNLYDLAIGKRSPIIGFKINRQLSTSTVDTHTKVSDWMSQGSGLKKMSKKDSSPSSFSSRARNFLRRKVSVAIDATPQARSDSILRQEPIEVTKFKSVDNPIIICQEIDVDSEFINPSEEVESNYRSFGFIEDESTDSSRMDRDELNSNPAYIYYGIHNTEQMTSFINADVNVTSRDKSVEKNPLTPEEQLLTIKRRNFPKVLPNTREAIDNDYIYMTSSKRPNSFYGISGRVPPVPPPRVSTLGRRRDSKTPTTSPLMLAQSLEEEEPEITENTLIIGPLLPKNHENLYSTLKRRDRSEKENLIDEETSQQLEIKSCSTSEGNIIKPSGIKPPSISLFNSNNNNREHINEIQIKTEPQSQTECVEKSVSSFPKVHKSSCENSRIPQLQKTNLKLSKILNTKSEERDKSSPDSSSSGTSSSTGTIVKSEAKK